MNTKKRYLVTSALPYANGPLHFGHIAGVYLPADIYCRHKKILKEKVIHISGSDEHGVAIMLSAEKEGTDYKTYVDKWNSEHKKLFSKYGIHFDYFGRTSEPYHKEEVLKWFHKLNEEGYIGQRPEKQLFCNSCARYLPDRYVEGTCYVCDFANARGDECPNCGEWIEPLRLKNPRCKIDNSQDLSIKESTHWYLLLTKLEEKFKPWFATKSYWKPHVWEYVNSLMKEGLIDRAITRDLSWGIDVPVKGAEGKKLYVWFDAPIGYVSNTKQMLKENSSNEDYLKDWWNNKDSEIIHFIGKDNIIFHALIWPSMILGTGFIQPPTQIPASHFVNLEGKQFSKSAGWYVDSEKAIDTFGETALRLYLCSLIPESGDTSFSWENFENANNELANKIGNFINRSTSFLGKHWPEGISQQAFEVALKAQEIEMLKGFIKETTNLLDQFQFQKALAALLRLGESANEMFHMQEPWKSIKTDRLATEQTMALSMIYILVINSLFRPFLPAFASALEAYFEPYLKPGSLDLIYTGNFEELNELFKNGYKLPLAPAPLLPRIEKTMVDPFRTYKK